MYIDTPWPWLQFRSPNDEDLVNPEYQISETVQEEIQPQRDM